MRLISRLRCSRSSPFRASMVESPCGNRATYSINAQSARRPPACTSSALSICRIPHHTPRDSAFAARNRRNQTDLFIVAQRICCNVIFSADLCNCHCIIFSPSAGRVIDSSANMPSTAFLSVYALEWTSSQENSFGNLLNNVLK